jgi:hypothetical protein
MKERSAKAARSVTNGSAELLTSAATTCISN